MLHKLDVIYRDMWDKEKKKKIAEEQKDQAINIFSQLWKNF